MSSKEPKKAATVLIADDDSMVREGLARALRRAGLKVTTAVDGSDVEDNLERSPFDVIVLDLQMPGKNGWEVIRSLKGRHAAVAGNPTSPPKIIVVSGRDEPETEEFARRLGADAFAVKPLLGQQLVDLVHRFL